MSEIVPINIGEAKAIMDGFEKFKQQILGSADFFLLDNKKHVKKSGWMKYALAMNVRTEIVDERAETIEINEKKILVWHFTVRASLINGRFMEAIGSASSDEREFKKPVHDLRALAQTRASNRAISNLVGGGEVSAEEMDAKTVDADYKVKQPDEDISGEDDIRDALEAAGLDPEGVEVVTRDWGKFEIKTNTKMDSDMWGKYHQVLKGLGAVYHNAQDPIVEFRSKWTVNV